ncbi:MAG: hypothetical protein KAV87_64350 [Desulfobacteraceae bacterium]|nr:hypothetical protein [Desulfobacteraceae bacterium]
MKSRIMKLAAVAVIITAALIAIQQSSSLIDRAILACADVLGLGNVQKYKTLTWKVSYPATGVIVQAMVLEPYYVRVELPDGKVWLLDRREKKVILMNPAKKTAKITFIEREPPHTYDALSNFKLKNIPRLSAEQIGQRQIGEKQAIGFRLGKKNGDNEAIVWVDLQTQLPIRIECLTRNKETQMKSYAVWTDIVFDTELDESLFEFDLEGYEVEEVDSG